MNTLAKITIITLLALTSFLAFNYGLAVPSIEQTTDHKALVLLGTLTNCIMLVLIASWSK